MFVVSRLGLVSVSGGNRRFSEPFPLLFDD